MCPSFSCRSSWFFEVDLYNYLNLQGRDQILIFKLSQIKSRRNEL